MAEMASANVARFLAERARTQPGTTAVLAPLGDTREGGIDYEALSFADLYREARQVALGLSAKGVGRGSRVLVMVKPGSDLIRCAFSLFMLGAVPVLIDPGMGLKHFLRCVARSEPDTLVGIPLAHAIRFLLRKPFRTVRHSLVVGGGFRRWFGKWNPDGFSEVTSPPDELAAILFTSGSTGPPKGVCYAHGQFDAQVHLIRDTFSIEPGEVDLPMLPIFSLFNPALGMTTVVPQMHPGRPAQVEPVRIVRAIEQCGVSNSFGSPVLWKKISAYLAQTGRQLPGLKRILMAGAPVPPALVRQMQPLFPHARLWSPYGATECLPVTAIEGSTILNETRLASEQGAGTCVGRPVAGVSIRIIHIEERVLSRFEEAREVTVGETGEIVATGPTVTRSYDRLPEATAMAKITDSEGRVWHRMGDAGYLDAEGRLWFCGRLAERVQTREGVLYTDCCEGILNTVTGVGRSALIGLGEAPEQEPAIVIEPEPGARPREEAVLAKAAEHEATRGIKTVFFCSAFPVDVRHNAKIHRLELRQRFSRTR